MSLILVASLFASIILNPPLTPNRLIANKPIRLFSLKKLPMFEYRWVTDRQVDYVAPSYRKRHFDARNTLLGGQEFYFVRDIERNAVPFDLPIGGWHYSPDGRYLLYFDSNEKGSRRALYDLFANPIVLKEYCDPAPKTAPQIVWLPDSKHWVEFTHFSSTFLKMKIRAIQDSSERTITLRGKFDDVSPIGFTHDGTLVLNVGYEALVNVNINTPSIPAKRFNFSLPGLFMEFVGVELSQKQNRLLWTGVVHQRPNLSLLFPVTSSNQKLNGAIWVVYYTSNLDGRNLQEAGMCLFEPPERFFWDMLRGRWFPDGKSFSFYYFGELYRYTLK